MNGKHLLGFYMTKQRNFGFDTFCNWGLATTHNYIWGQTQPPQLPHTLLGRFCFLFSCGSRLGNKTDVYAAVIFTLHSEMEELTERFNERHALYVTNSTSKLYNADFRNFIVPIYWYLSNALHPFLYSISDVRNNLHSFSEVVPPPLPVDDVLVYFAGRDVVVAVEGDVEESLVVTKVKVNFTPIVQHKDFTMLIGGECARINVNVGIDLDGGDPDPTGFEDHP